jgi:hypothetical protein
VFVNLSKAVLKHRTPYAAATLVAGSTFREAFGVRRFTAAFETGFLELRI